MKYMLLFLLLINSLLSFPQNEVHKRSAASEVTIEKNASKDQSLLNDSVPIIGVGLNDQDTKVFSKLNQKRLHDSTKLETVKTTDIDRTDTIWSSFEDSISLTKNELDSAKVKIFIQPAPSNNDHFKYIFPILTLLLGIGVNKFLDYLSERKKIKKVGERWIAEILFLKTPISNQIKSLEEFLIEHKKQKFIVPTLIIYSGLDCEIFKTLDKSELLKFLEKKKKYKEAVLSSNNIHGYIGVLASHYDSLKTKFDDYINASSAHTSSLTENLQLLMQAFGFYGVLLEKEIKGDPINDPRYKPISDLFNSEIIPSMEDGDYDIYTLEEKFFKPLIEILGSLRQDERVNNLSIYSSRCLNFIKGIKKWRKSI